MDASGISNSNTATAKPAEPSPSASSRSNESSSSGGPSSAEKAAQANKTATAQSATKSASVQSALTASVSVQTVANQSKNQSRRPVISDNVARAISAETISKKQNVDTNKGLAKPTIQAAPTALTSAAPPPPQTVQKKAGGAGVATAISAPPKPKGIVTVKRSTGYYNGQKAAARTAQASDFGAGQTATRLVGEKDTATVPLGNDKPAPPLGKPTKNVPIGAPTISEQAVQVGGKVSAPELGRTQAAAQSKAADIGGAHKAPPPPAQSNDGAPKQEKPDLGGN